MTSFYAQNRLRIVGRDDPDVVDSWRERQRAKDSVARENRAAGYNTTLDPTDPRWVLAVRAFAQLDGSTLTPERRERILKTARQLGVRLFDANIIIAIVQDQARRGGTLHDAVATLSLIEKPDRRRVLNEAMNESPRAHIINSISAEAMMMASAILCAIVVAIGIILWLRAS